MPVNSWIFLKKLSSHAVDSNSLRNAFHFCRVLCQFHLTMPTSTLEAVITRCHRNKIKGSTQGCVGISE